MALADTLTLTTFTLAAVELVDTLTEGHEQLQSIQHPLKASQA